MGETAHPSTSQLPPLRLFFGQQDRRLLIPLIIFALVVRTVLLLLIPMNTLPDSYDHLVYAMMVRQGISFTLPWGWFALYYFFLAPLLWGPDPLTTARFTSVILWTGATVLVYLIARQMTLPPKTSAFAALLYSVTPYNLILSVNSMPEALLSVAFFAAILLYLRLRVTITAWNAVGLAASLLIASLTRIEGMVLTVQVAFLLVASLLTTERKHRRHYLLLVSILIIITIGVFLHKAFFLSPGSGDPSGYRARLLDPARVIYHIVTYGRYLGTLPSMITPLLLFLGVTGALFTIVRKTIPLAFDVSFLAFSYLLLYPVILIPYIGEFILYVFPRYNIFPLALLCILGASWLVPAVESAFKPSQLRESWNLGFRRIKIPKTLIALGAILLILTAAIGVTAQAAYLEMKIHIRVTQPYYQTSLWLGEHCNATDRILLENFVSNGIVIHSGIPSDQFIPTSSLPENESQALTYMQDNNITFIVWSLRDPVCRTHPLLAPLASGENQTHFLLCLKLEDFIHDLHELVIIYQFIP